MVPGLGPSVMSPVGTAGQEGMIWNWQSAGGDGWMGKGGDDVTLGPGVD